MAFREVRVYEVREVLRLWLAGEGYRSIERLSQVDRKTVRRYVEAAVADDWWRVTLPNNLGTSSAGAPAYVAYIAALNILDADVLLAREERDVRHALKLHAAPGVGERTAVRAGDAGETVRRDVQRPARVYALKNNILRDRRTTKICARIDVGKDDPLAGARHETRHQ